MGAGLLLNGRTSTITAHLQAVLRAHKPVLRAFVTDGEALWRGIFECPEEAYLDAWIHMVQAAYQQGHIADNQQDVLTNLLVYMGRLLRAGYVNLPVAEERTEATEKDACYCCGQTARWIKPCGQRVCAICHPPPNDRPKAQSPSAKISTPCTTTKTQSWALCLLVKQE